jgi:hypothetical protein
MQSKLVFLVDFHIMRCLYTVHEKAVFNAFYTCSIDRSFRAFHIQVTANAVLTVECQTNSFVGYDVSFHVFSIIVRVFVHANLAHSFRLGGR